MVFQQFNATSTIIVLGLSLYVALVRFFRHERSDAISSAFGRDRDLGTMTTQEAQEIITQLQQLEFPFAFNTARTVALLKAGGIPSMSKLFAVTGQNNRKNAGKRAVDTEILIRESHSHQRESLRYQQAVARMNYLHSRYRKANKILDLDMLHTLGSGLYEVLRVVKQQEWRRLTRVEICALGVFHRNLGEDMGIPFEALPSFHEGWRDGGHFAQELADWTVQYEYLVAVPTPTNDQYVRVYVDSTAATLPKMIRISLRKMIGYELDDTMRKSLGIEAPGFLLTTSLQLLSNARKFILRHLSLPRPSFLAIDLVSPSTNPVSGLYNFDHFGFQPWYIRPSIRSRMHPMSLFVRALGGRAAGSKGDRYYPQGYDLRTIGPLPQEGKGLDEMASWIKMIEANSLSSCPFHRKNASLQPDGPVVNENTGNEH